MASSAARARQAETKILDAYVGILHGVSLRARDHPRQVIECRVPTWSARPAMKASSAAVRRRQRSRKSPDDRTAFDACGIARGLRS